jgi:glycosyltransferase involved in cell wall biosynthesis
VKVCIVNNMAPFVWGGAEELAVHLKRNLEIAGHTAEVLRIPFQWEPATGIPAQMLLVNNLELSNVDRVIALKFPAYLIRHPHKTFWLLHQYRQAYDLFDAAETNLPPGLEGERIRRVIKGGDDAVFAEARAIFTNSAVTRDRLRKYNGFDAEVLLPPVNDPEIFADGQFGDYIFAGGRVNSLKRQYLLIEALRHADNRVKLVVGGPADTPQEEARLRHAVQQAGVEDRVKLDVRFLPRQRYADYVKGSAGVVYIPFDEDSLGYVAMEAATAGKPLITTSDSGGILGLVRQDETGWVAEPSPESLGEAMSKIMADRQRAERHGEAAKALWNSMKINWPHTIERLLA